MLEVEVVRAIYNVFGIKPVYAGILLKMPTRLRYAMPATVIYAPIVIRSNWTMD